MRRSLAAVLVAALLFLLPLAASAQTSEADVFVAQAILDFNEQRYVEALANLRRALEIQPDHLEAIYYTGAVHLARRDATQALPFLERAREKAPGDPAVNAQLGLAHFALGRYDQAQARLEEAFRADPTIDGLGYYVGFLRYRNKDYRGALVAFRASRTTDPELQQLTRLYTGLALGVLGLTSEAAAEVDQALRVAPGSAVTGPAERLRDTLVAGRGRDKRLSLEARLGFFYDDNVIVEPRRDDAEPLVGVLRHPKNKSTGEIFGIRADYTWWRTEAWESTVGYSFFATYNNDLPSFNIMDHLASASIARNLTIGTMPAQLGLSYSFDWLFLDEEDFLKRHSIAVTGAVVESDMHLTQVIGRFQDKAYAGQDVQQLRQEFRDGQNWMAGFVHLVRFAQDRHFLRGGYQFDVEDTDGDNYDYIGHRISLGAQYTLPWKAIRLKYDFDVHFRKYQHSNTLLPTQRPNTTKRRDEEITNVVRAELPLPYNFTLSGEVLVTTANSNIEVFAFDRRVYSLILSWSY